MERLHAQLAVSMSGFKQNPAAVLRESSGQPVAVLNHNRVAFYVVEPAHFKALLRAQAAAESTSDSELPASKPGVHDPGLR